MTVIAVCNQKGGSGKTTMAINLAGAFAAEDKRVLLLDLDPQGSALDWGSINPDTMAQVEVAEIDRPQLLRQARALRREYDVIVIDCPAKFADSSSAAIRVADFVLVPVQPSPFDVWASDAVAGLIKSELASGRLDRRRWSRRLRPGAAVKRTPAADARQRAFDASPRVRHRRNLRQVLRADRREHPGIP